MSYKLLFNVYCFKTGVKANLNNYPDSVVRLAPITSDFWRVKQ
jgi:hypothetical protein